MSNEHIILNAAQHDPAVVRKAVDETIHNLEAGRLRVASQDNTHQWHTHAWIKEAILLYFQYQSNQLYTDGITHFYDKVPLRFATATSTEIKALGTRIVPPAYIRAGVFLGQDTVVMPSHINIGAYIDTGTMIDTWANIGSCAQIGKNVHIASGVTIGGVLEPMRAHPTIIEDECFIGAHCALVEGILVERGAVLATGVHLSQSTPIIDRTTDEVYYGRVPAYSVVVPGTREIQPGLNIQCAVIAKQADDQTRHKVSLNEVLRYDGS